MSPHPIITTTISTLARKHLHSVAAPYDSQASQPTTAARSYRSLLAHYYNLLIPADASVIEIGCGDGERLAHLKTTNKAGVDISVKQLEQARE